MSFAACCFLVFCTGWVIWCLCWLGYLAFAGLLHMLAGWVDACRLFSLLTG